MNSKFYCIIVLFFAFFGILFLFTHFSNSLKKKESLETLSNNNNLDIPKQPLFLTLSKDFLNTNLSKDFCKFNQNLFFSELFYKRICLILYL